MCGRWEEGKQVRGGFWEGRLMHKQTHRNSGTSSWMRDKTKTKEGVEEEGGGTEQERLKTVFWATTQKFSHLKQLNALFSPSWIKRKRMLITLFYLKPITNKRLQDISWNVLCLKENLSWYFMHLNASISNTWIQWSRKNPLLVLAYLNGTCIWIPWTASSSAAKLNPFSAATASVSSVLLFRIKTPDKNGR